MRTLAKALCAAALLVAPSFAFAAATASIVAVFPTDGKVGVGTRASFSVLSAGFTNPTYYLTDSFPGGATTQNMDGFGNFVWTPNNDDIGTHVMTVLVTDTQGNTASVSYSFEVVAPQVSTQTTPPASVQYGSPISFALTYSGFTNPTITVEDSFFNSSITSYNLVGNVFNWTPQKKDVGTHTLTIKAKDSTGRVHSIEQKIVVLGIPSVSVLNLMPGTTVGVGEKLSFSPYVSEMTSPEVTVKDLFYNGATTTHAFDGKLVTWTPVYNDVGIHQFIITSTEPSTGRVAVAELRIGVSPYKTMTTTNTGTTTTSTTGTANASSPAGSQASASASATGAAASSYVFRTYLGVGSTGTAVTELQRKLKASGYLSVEPTGYYGSLTKKAVQDFQKANGLEQVGYVGPGTRAALNK